MSTRSTTHFVDSPGADPEAIIYRHSDGYPTGQGADLLQFFADVTEQAKDTRFGDPTYLAARLVVWLARRFADSYDGATGKVTNHADTRPLDFLSVGVCLEDPGDIQYRYVIDCGSRDEQGYPVVEVQTADGNVLGELRAVLMDER